MAPSGLYARLCHAFLVLQCTVPVINSIAPTVAKRYEYIRRCPFHSFPMIRPLSTTTANDRYYRQPLRMTSCARLTVTIALSEIDDVA